MDQYTSVGFLNRSFKEKVCAFLRERKKAIIFMFFRYITLVFDMFSISKKIIRGRGHVVYGLIVVALLLLNGVLGSAYSLYCHIFDKISVEEQEEQEGRPLHSVEDVYGIELNQKPFEDDNDLKSLGSSTEEEEPEEEPGQPKKGKKKKRKKVVMVEIPLSSSTPEKSRPEMRGTVINPGLSDPRGDPGDNTALEISTYEIPWSKMYAGFRKCSLNIKILHCLTIFPKECKLYESSRELWKYLGEPYNKQALEAIDGKGQVKRVCFEKTWYQYCYKEQMRKQLSLLMAVALAAPMILVELMYWSTEKIATESETSFLDISLSWTSTNFNIAELISLLLNIGQVSYRLVSLMNQSRKLNFNKGDMTFCHNLYLVFVYMLFLISRVVCLYSVMMLNTACVIFTCSLLLLQLTVSLLFTLDLVRDGNTITSIVSNVMMLFLYVPPPGVRKLSPSKYYMIIMLEMVMLFIFGWYHVNSLGETGKVYVLGRETDPGMFYYLYLASAGMYVLFVVLNCPWKPLNCPRKLFRSYVHPTLREIESDLREVNSKFDTNYKLLLDELNEQRTTKSHELTVFLY